MKRRPCTWLLFGLMAVSGFPAESARTGGARQNIPTPVIANPNPPIDVDLSATNGLNDFITRFDDLAWRAFLAMVWPAKIGWRGMPDTTLTASDLGPPRVFETFKATWESFHNQPNSPPAPWNQYDDWRFNPTRRQAVFGDLVLASFAHSEVRQAGVGPSFWPLPAQNGYYTRYETSFNQTEFNAIQSQGLYNRSKLIPGVTLPVGSIDIKSAWVLMANLAHPERYYTRWAWVRTTVANREAFVVAPVCLVGLHIVLKTPLCPQWIWCSFEQEDNVPSVGSIGPYVYNDGSGQGQPPVNPYAGKPLYREPVTPFNVVRARPILASTELTNQAYHQALPANSIWRHYKLVLTQWPLIQGKPSNTGNPQFSFPGFPDRGSNIANMALETYHQGPIQYGCMNCHTTAQRNSDFLWTMLNHAYPDRLHSSGSGSRR